MKHDAIYARYSSHAQDDSTSIEVQIETCERAAGGACRQYVDRAKTGRTMAGRSQLLALLADAASGKLKRVFVYKFDRFGRDAETHTIVRDLEEHGVEVVSATEGTNQLARGIQLVVAEDYSRQLANRTRDGLAKRFEQGGFTGGVPPYGFHVVTREGRRVLEVEPAEAAIVREVAGWYLSEAVGFKSIAKRLRDRAVASRRGKGWTFTSIRSLMLNPVLTGKIRFNVRKMHLDRRSGRRVPRARVEAEHMERKDESLRILSDETFAKIGERIGRSGKGHQSARLGRQVAKFTGLVFCGCGAKCYKVTSRNAKGESAYYVCSRHLRYDDCPVNGRAREDVIMATIKRKLNHIFGRADEIMAGMVEVATEAVRGNRAAADRLKAQIAEVEGEQARHVELLMDRQISDAAKQAISRKMTETEARRAELQASLDRLREDANDNTEAIAAMAKQVFDEARAGLASATTPEAFNRFAERFCGPMTVGADGSVGPKQNAPAGSRGVVQRYVAGGRCEPLNFDGMMQAAVWAAAA